MRTTRRMAKKMGKLSEEDRQKTEVTSAQVTIKILYEIKIELFSFQESKLM